MKKLERPVGAAMPYKKKRYSDLQRESGCGPECTSQGSKDNLWLHSGIP